MDDKLETYINGIKNLPATPTVMVRLVSAFQQPDRDVDDIVNLMRQDPSLTAEVLRHSNSAYFSHEEPIVDVFEAITRIGFYEVYKAAVAKLGTQTLNVPTGASRNDVEQLWRHSSMAAVLAGSLAQKVRENESVAFTAGLLHDVGKIVLAAAEGNRYAALKAEVGSGGAALQAAERIMFGFGHAEVGGRLLEKWGLPTEILAPVRSHHSLKWDRENERICAVVNLGNHLAHAAEAGAAETLFTSSDAVSALCVLQLREDDISAILEDSKDEITRMNGLFSVAA